MDNKTDAVENKKKCPKCGEMYALDSLFCRKCGTGLESANGIENEPVNEIADESVSESVSKPTNISVDEPVKETEEQNVAPKIPAVDTEDKKAGKKLLPVAVAVIVVLAFIVKVIGGGGSYKKPYDTCIKAINARKMHASDFQYYNFHNGSFYESLGDTLKDTDFYQQYLEEEKANYEELYESMDINAGKNWKAKIVYNYAEKLDKDDIKEWQDFIDEHAEYCKLSIEEEDLAEFLSNALGEEITKKQAKKLLSIYNDKYIDWLEKGKIKEAYYVDADIIIDGPDDEHTYENRNVVVCKINGEWFIVSGGDNGGFTGGLYGTFHNMVRGLMMASEGKK